MMDERCSRVGGEGWPVYYVTRFMAHGSVVERGGLKAQWESFEREMCYAKGGVEIGRNPVILVVRMTE